MVNLGSGVTALTAYVKKGGQPPRLRTVLALVHNAPESQNPGPAELIRERSHRVGDNSCWHQTQRTGAIPAACFVSLVTESRYQLTIILICI